MLESLRNKLGNAVSWTKGVVHKKTEETPASETSAQDLHLGDKTEITDFTPTLTPTKDTAGNVSLVPDEKFKEKFDELFPFPKDDKIYPNTIREELLKDGKEITITKYTFGDLGNLGDEGKFKENRKPVEHTKIDFNKPIVLDYETACPPNIKEEYLSSLPTDDKSVTIGSYNWDAPSLLSNNDEQRLFDRFGGNSSNPLLQEVKSAAYFDNLLKASESLNTASVDFVLSSKENSEIYKANLPSPKDSDKEAVLARNILQDKRIPDDSPIKQEAAKYLEVVEQDPFKEPKKSDGLSIYSPEPTRADYKQLSFPQDNKWAKALDQINSPTIQLHTYGEPIKDNTLKNPVKHEKILIVDNEVALKGSDNIDSKAFFPSKETAELNWWEGKPVKHEKIKFDNDDGIKGSDNIDSKAFFPSKEAVIDFSKPQTYQLGNETLTLRESNGQKELTIKGSRNFDPEGKEVGVRVTLSEKMAEEVKSALKYANDQTIPENAPIKSASSKYLDDMTSALKYVSDPSIPDHAPIKIASRHLLTKIGWVDGSKL